MPKTTPPALTGVAVARNPVFGPDANQVVAGPPAFTGVAVARNHVCGPDENQVASPAEEWREVDVGDDGEWHDVAGGEESEVAWDGAPGTLPMVRSYALDIPTKRLARKKFDPEVDALFARITDACGGQSAKKGKTAGAAGAAGGGTDKI